MRRSHHLSSGRRLFKINWKLERSEWSAILSMSKRFHLTEEQRRQLRSQLCSTEDVDLYRKTLALLEVNQGRSPMEVSRSLGVSCSSVYNWLNAFELTPSPKALADHRGRGRHSFWTDALCQLLLAALHKKPGACGYQALRWTVPLLQEHLRLQAGVSLSDPTIRRKLHRDGYSWGPFGFALKGIPPSDAKPPKSKAVVQYHGLQG